ncbi:hypothetical protein K474DRAFT_1608968 [Panus rudis PR-1116 ss-1]|nr:hypothetical protein K474DRAFT_1608968 [Panus rudis PR-1116 ss-1]
MHAVWLRNRTTTVNTPNSTPYERATGQKPNLASLPRFGAIAWVLQSADSKLAPQSKEGRWVGYDAESKAHRVYWPDKRTVSVERNVKIDNDNDVVVEVSLPSQGEHLPAPAPPPIQSTKPETTKSEPVTKVDAATGPPRKPRCKAWITSSLT